MGKFKHDTYMPGNVRYANDLNQSSKFLYSALLYYCDEEGIYYKNFELFSSLLDRIPQMIERYFGDLEKNNYIKTIHNKDYIVGKLKSINLKGKGFGENVCEWCGINTYIIHEHHYPIPKKDEGRETVSICPTCHSAFHYFPNLIKITDLDVVNYVEKQYKKHGEQVMSIDYKG